MEAIMPTIPDQLAAQMRRSLIVSGDLPSEIQRRTRWRALLHHRRANRMRGAMLRFATPDDAA